MHIELTQPKVICGFPGIGKSYLSKRTGWQDSDSSLFSWVGQGEDRKRNPEFPANYVQHIRGCHGVVLCSTHKEVRDALASAGISFILAYPDRSCKDEYIERYKSRGSSKAFVELLGRMWEDWITEMEQEDRAVKKIIVGSGQFLQDCI